MAEDIRIAFLAESAPVSSNFRAHALYPVNRRLCLALLEHISIITVTRYLNDISINEIDNELQGICQINTFPRIILTATRYLFPNLLNEELASQKYLQKIVKKIHKSNVNWLFSPCGVNPYDLKKSLDIAKVSEISLAVYLVDDFLSGAILSGNKEHLKLAQENVASWLHQVQKIFVISEGLRKRVKQLYGLDSIVLPLPYEISDTALTNLPDQQYKEIFFLGSLSHFYLDGVKQMASILENINKKLNQPINLRLTLNKRRVKPYIDLDKFKYIKCLPSTTTESLHQEINSSLMCFAPYSFDEKYRDMVSSSFPSKMLDYLVAGKFVLTYAPEYSSSVSYFRDNQLPQVLCTEDTSMLQEIILHQLESKLDYNQQYRAIVRQQHSYNKISKIVISALNSKKGVINKID